MSRLVEHAVPSGVAYQETLRQAIDYFTSHGSSALQAQKQAIGWIGQQVATRAAPNFTRIQLELGSKNPLVVMDDGDMELAVAHALNGAYFGSGQKCTASSRLIVHRKVHDEFVSKLKAKAEALVVGHALDEGTQIGPVVDEKQLAQALDYVKIAEKEGCERVCGGERTFRHSGR